MHRWVGFVLVLFFITTGSAQENGKSIQAVQTSEPITIDGVFNEQIWQKALPISDFTQKDPRESEKATEKTEVRVLYDENNIYIGITCFDSEPDKIIHNELKRDGNIESDDNVAIILDTYRDFRSGFYFETNPNGARGDALIASQEHTNPDWNGVWDVGAKITETGWNVEIIIPIKTLRFPNTEESAWGFNVRRMIKRKNEEVLWSAWKRNDGLLQLSKAGMIKGLKNLRMKRMIEVKPFSLGGREKQVNSHANTFKYGVDAKYPITSTLVLDMTANTDFAQVEADQTEINLTRFDIQYPEKRDFFLEGSETFKFGAGEGDVFYTRRIGITPDRKQVPILGGARLTGKIGSYQIGFLNMQTDNTNGFSSTNYTVTRIKKDVFQKSYIGFMGTNLANTDGHNNQALGADFSLQTASFMGNNNFAVNGAVTGTITDGKANNSTAGYLKIDYPNDHADHYFQYYYVPNGFNPEIGFIPRKGIKIYQAGLRFSPRPKIPFLRRYHFMPLSINYITDMHGKLLTREFEFRPIGLEFNSGDTFEFNVKNSYDFLDKDFNIFGNSVIPKGTYEWWFYEAEFETNSRRKLAMEFHSMLGNFYTGKRMGIRPEITFKFNENVAVSTGFDHNEISLYNQRFSADAYNGRLILNYSTRLTSRTFVQWNNEDKKFFVNFLINYIPKIGSDIYFVYNQIWDSEYNYRVYSRTGIFKIAYLFRF